MVSGKNLLWWLAGCLFAWRLVYLALIAFSQPWTGTSEQWEFGLFVFCALAVAVTLATVVRRHGLVEVRRRLRRAPALYRAYGERPDAGKAGFRNLLIWIIVALVLVVVFLFQQHG